MGAQQRFNTISIQRSTSIGNIKVRTPQQHFNPVRDYGALCSGLMSFENGVCAILNQFQNLSVTVPAGEDCLFNSEMFPDVTRRRLVGL